MGSEMCIRDRVCIARCWMTSTMSTLRQFSCRYSTLNTGGQSRRAHSLQCASHWIVLSPEVVNCAFLSTLSSLNFQALLSARWLPCWVPRSVLVSIPSAHCDPSPVCILLHTNVVTSVQYDPWHPSRASVLSGPSFRLEPSMIERHVFCRQWQRFGEALTLGYGLMNFAG